MTDSTPDYVIQECLDTDTFEVYFIIATPPNSPYWPTTYSKRFECLAEAETALRLLRKHKNVIYHYVD